MNVLKKAGLLVSLLSTGFGLTASADSFLINTGSDVAPYEFLSSLNRGAYSTLYTFDGDGHGFDHRASNLFDSSSNEMDAGA